MVPTAVSQVIEAVSRLIFGYAFAFIAIKLGYSVEIAAAATILGVVVSTVAGMIYMLIREAVAGTIKKLPPSNAKPKREIGRQLRNIAIPITIVSGVMSLTNFIDMYVIQNRLQTIGYSEQGASTLYGIYETMCVSMMNLPQTLIAAVTVSLVPMIAASVAQSNQHRAQRTVESSLRLVSLMAFPCAIGLFVLTEPILSPAVQRGRCDRRAAFADFDAGDGVHFLCLDHKRHPAGDGEGARLALQYAGGVRHQTFGQLLSDWDARRRYCGCADWHRALLCGDYGGQPCYYYTQPAGCAAQMGSILKPALAAAVMGAFILLVYPWLSSVVGAKLAALIMICAGAALYVITLIAVHGFYREDIVMLPKGEK